jgi:hypothetical protein
MAMKSLRQLTGRGAAAVGITSRAHGEATIGQCLLECE